jgi:hypothetical protein
MVDYPIKTVREMYYRLEKEDSKTLESTGNRNVYFATVWPCCDLEKRLRKIQEALETEHINIMVSGVNGCRCCDALVEVTAMADACKGVK